ncbi:unnamed protein product [Vicia faba]|uniref:Uncharacterized protein n=1 Tax=Vicia faba TaxID=3906 RepID=A0AAV0YKM5_VICFA|nr:unnamed protein product [Vicia faba]
MARPIEAVKDINNSKGLLKIAVRCKHLWTVTSASKKEHIEMILVDSELDMIQVIVQSFLVSKFKEQLALNILHLDAIVEGKFQSNILVDILGGVTEISQTQINADNKKRKVVFSITDNRSRSEVQCTLWGQLAIQFHNYYKSYKEDGSIIVFLINARIKEAQGGFPSNISNAWNGTKFLINDVTLDVVIKLRDSLQPEFPLFSSSSLQVDTTQNLYYSDFDKLVWKEEILSLAEITTLQHETTCVTVATLDKFEDGQSSRPTPVPRYKLEVLVVDGKYKAIFIFWDGDCVKLIGKSALQMKSELIEAGEDDPLEFPYALDAILK